MTKIDLTKYGITGTTEIVHNPSYEQLFVEETKPGPCQGYEKGQVTDTRSRKRDDRYLHRTLAQRQVHRDGRRNSRDTDLVDDRRVTRTTTSPHQRRRPGRRAEGHRDRGTFAISVFSSSTRSAAQTRTPVWLIRFIVEVGLAGAFRNQYVHSPDRGRTADFVRTRLRGL